MPARANPGTPQRPRAVTGLATAAITMILLELVGEALDTVSDWRDYLVVHDYLAGAATDSDLTAADNFRTSVGIPTLITYIAAAIVFLVWLWKVRINAELLRGRASQRRSRSWVVSSWFAAFAFWIVHQVMTDIYQASAPRRPVSRTLVTSWLGVWLASTAITQLYLRAVRGNAVTEQSLHYISNLSTISLALDVVAGYLIILIIRRITTWQTQQLGLATT